MDFIDISDQAVGIAYQAMAILTYIAVVMLMTRLALTRKLFTKRISAKKQVEGIALGTTIALGIALICLVLVPTTAVLVMVSTLFIMACLAVPKMVRNAVAWTGESMTRLLHVAMGLPKLASMIRGTVRDWWVLL